MLFSSVPRVRRGSAFPSMQLLARTLHQWLYFCSGQLARLLMRDLHRRLLSLSVRLSVTSQTMPSCTSPQDVIMVFLRPRVDSGDYNRYLLLGGSSHTSMAVRACYVAVLLYVCGFLALGSAFQKHDSVGALIMGWGIAEVAIMVNTVAVCASLFDARSTCEVSSSICSDAYANDCFPKHQGEISALLNLARTLGGFSVAYFQVPWATKHGALQTFGCEAA